MFAAGFAGILPSQAADTVKIGVLTIQSGALSPIGGDILAGIQTAVAQQGKLLGKDIELVVEDSAANAQQAVSKANKLVQQNGVVALLGTSTVEALALLPVAERLRVPIITSNAGSETITGANCSRWVFRTNPSEAQSEVALRYLVSPEGPPELRGAKLFTLGHDYPWSRLVAATAKRLPGVTYVGEAFAPLDTTDWAPFIAQARAAGATAVLTSVTLGTPLLQFVQQAEEFGLTREATLVAPIGLPDWLVAQLGKTSASIISAGSWAAWRYEDENPATRTFNTAFYKQHGRVAGMQTQQSASAAQTLFQAIEATGSTDPEKIVAALEKTDIVTPIGPLRFQENGRQALSSLFIGRYDAVTPPRYGAEYAQKVSLVIPASRTITKTAQELGCNLKK